MGGGIGGMREGVVCKVVWNNVWWENNKKGKGWVVGIDIYKKLYGVV